MTDEDRKWEPAPSWKPTHVQDSGWNRATSKKAKNTAETDWRNRERDRDRDDLNKYASIGLVGPLGVGLTTFFFQLDAEERLFVF